jgi:hypothetical protein
MISLYPAAHRLSKGAILPLEFPDHLMAAHAEGETQCPPIF